VKEHTHIWVLSPHAQEMVCRDCAAIKILFGHPLYCDDFLSNIRHEPHDFEFEPGGYMFCIGVA